MRYVPKLVLLMALVLPHGLSGQTHIASADTLRAQAAVLAACYRFSWLDSIRDLPASLPVTLELTSVFDDALGYHRVGFFHVRPAETPHGRRLWRPLKADSIEIELTASPILSPNDVVLTGKLVRDTLRGEVVEVTILPDSGLASFKLQTSTRGAFRATRSKCQ